MKVYTLLFMITIHPAQWRWGIAQLHQFSAPTLPRAFAEVMPDVAICLVEVRGYGMLSVGKFDMFAVMQWENRMQSVTTRTLLTSTKRAEFAQRYRECINSYPFTPPGERQVLAYATERTNANQRYAEIVALSAQGADTTEAIMQGLLPHFDTAGTDMLRVSGAVWRFVERCITDPAALRVACEDFAATPGVKGIQMGMLTPILQMLRPDAFLQMTHATRTVVNRLAGTNYGVRLSAYPEANATAQHVLGELDDILHQRMAPSLSSADAFDFFCQWVMAVKPLSFEQPHAWRIAVADVEQWRRWQAEGYVALAAPACPDLAVLDREGFAAWAATNIPRVPATPHLWNFAHAVREGDRILVHQGTHTQLGIAVVTGPYYATPEARDCHRLPVRWATNLPTALKKSGWQAPFGKIQWAAPEPSFSDQPDTQIASMGAQLAESPARYDTPRTNGRTAPYTLAQCADETGLDAGLLEHWLRAIDRTGQAIIVGPPGTGKTYLAEHLARVLRGTDGLVEMVQFHPAYAYEDFVQGLRPVSQANGALSYALVPGRFLTFCQQARLHAGTCVLIIDEINRANLAQVFGEVMSLLEYRERVLPLAGGGTMQIPANVRILGTMNTADRSIALVDHALRRRFAFLNLRPNYDVLRRFHAASDGAVEGLIGVLQRINAAIGDSHYALGISYFLRVDLAEQLADIWQMEIEPYLEEYFFDQPEEVAAWRWEAVKKHLQGKGPRPKPSI